ncbi:MAG: NUDIX hydrolase [Candidatus Saccharimonadales bacterium]
MNAQCYYRLSIKGIEVDAVGRVLLAREDSGRWELLGGGLDHGESPHEGLRREIREETGLMVAHISAAPHYFLTCQRFNADTFVANVVYKIELENLDFTPSSECQELRFFSVQEMSTLPLFPNVEELRKLLLAEQEETKRSEINSMNSIILGEKE